MNLLLAFVGGLALAAPQPAAPAQTAPARAASTAAHRNPSPSQARAIKARTAERRAEAYKGPHVVKNGKALGKKFIQESKPANTPVAPPVQRTP